MNKIEVNLLPKFNSARAFATSNGWDFKVFTEKEIRTTYLENIKFLKKFIYFKIENYKDFKQLIQTIYDLNHTTPTEVVLACGCDKRKRNKVLCNIWHMIATGDLLCDLNLKLTMESEIWLKQV